MKSKILNLFAFLALLLAGHAQAAQSVTFYHHDALGSVIAKSDSDGYLYLNEEYQPYGEKIYAAEDFFGGSDDWYTGKNYSEELDLTYFGARWYDAKQGRFLSVDPIGVALESFHSFNRYVYAINNPYRYIDPDGREIKSTRVVSESATETNIKFTGVMIDRTGTLSRKQLVSLAARMESQIESSFSGGSDSDIWNTDATIDIGSPGETLRGRHEINIQHSSFFRKPTVLGNVNKIGGSTINLNFNLRRLDPLTTTTNASFERTAAHEFGHAASLKHPSGGLMSQTQISNRLDINKAQIDEIHKNNP
jgi:RHS repeat-associated protein